MAVLGLDQLLDPDGSRADIRREKALFLLLLVLLFPIHEELEALLIFVARPDLALIKVESDPSRGQLLAICQVFILLPSEDQVNPVLIRAIRVNPVLYLAVGLPGHHLLINDIETSIVLQYACEDFRLGDLAGLPGQLALVKHPLLGLGQP